MGADPNKLRSREETINKYRTALPGEIPRDHVAVVVSSSNHGMVGYSNVYIDAEKNGFAHVHIVDLSQRSQGIATTMFPMVMPMFIDVYGIRRLIFMTCPENEAVNGLLKKFGLKPERIYNSNPSGMARAGEFCRYVLDLAPFQRSSS
jgi:RimJ/RimL family protein N-acetyltransferase